MYKQIICLYACVQANKQAGKQVPPLVYIRAHSFGSVTPFCLWLEGFPEKIHAKEERGEGGGTPPFSNKTDWFLVPVYDLVCSI